MMAKKKFNSLAVIHDIALCVRSQQHPRRFLQRPRPETQATVEKWTRLLRPYIHRRIFEL